MNSFSALHHALSGIQAGHRGLEQSAHEIATAGSAEPVDLADPLIDAMQHQRALEASANVMRRVDDTLGMLIDTFA